MLEQSVSEFYAAKIRVCGNCKAAWEPFDPADLLDSHDHMSCFTEPCDNCAFRPRSNEQRNRKKWRELVNKLKAGAEFFCHKGVPLKNDVDNSTAGFDYPTKEVAGHPGVKTYDTKRMRHCRGWLNMIDLEEWTAARARASEDG